MILLHPTLMSAADAAPPNVPAPTPATTEEGTPTLTTDRSATPARYTWPPPGRTRRRGWKAGRSR